MHGGDVESPGAYLMPQFTGTRDFRSYMRILWRWKFVLLAFPDRRSLGRIPVRAGQAQHLPVERPGGSQLRDRQHLGSRQQRQLLDHERHGNRQLVTTRPVARDAAGRMRPPPIQRQIASEVSASGNQTTNFITITATDRNPSVPRRSPMLSRRRSPTTRGPPPSPS